MNRYISSFVATAMLYVTVMATFLYSYEEPKTLQSKNKQSDQNVKFTVISQEKQTPKKNIEPKKIVKKTEPKIAKKIVKKIQEKKTIKNIEPKKIVKKIVKVKKAEPKKSKKVIEKKIVKKIIENENKKEIKKLVKKEIKKSHPNTQIKNIVSKDKTTQNIDNNKQKEIYKKEYFIKLKQIISKNKSYPKTAVRRNIEGDVKISFTVSPNGELLDFKILDGHRIFKKSIQKAMKKESVKNSVSVTNCNT